MRLRELLTSASIATAVATFSFAPVQAAENSGGQQTQGNQGKSGDAINLVKDWNYDPLYSKGLSAQRLLDADVYDAEGDDVIGEVENLVVSPQGRITDLIIETGGVLEIGDTHLLYPFDKARIASADAVYVEIREDDIEDYSLFPEVDDNPLQGKRWRITQLINDYAALGGEIPYGMVDDVVINKKGEILAVVVQPDLAYDYYGYYAWPYYGYEHGFEPGLPYYSVPYSEQEVADLAAFEYGALAPPEARTTDSGKTGKTGNSGN